MTIKEKTREQRMHDIIYSCDHRPELAERIVSLEDENDELRRKVSESEKDLSDMRDELVGVLILAFGVYEDMDAAFEKAKGLADAFKDDCMANVLNENAKLRELVRDLYHLSDTYFEEREPYWWKPYEQRMRELGVEVEG